MISSSRGPRPLVRSRLVAGSSVSALCAAFWLAAPQAAHAQASTTVADPAGSTSSVANQNEAVSASDQKAANAAATGDATPAQTEAAGQAAGAATAQATGSSEAGEIVVTGFRRSLETAIAEKKNRDQVVESVSSEDIGKLPDASIAESIARLPGLTAQRSSGRDTTISIRGFAPDFSTTLLNGREQTSTGDNRAVEYDQYPAEVINQVLVYKTGQANLVGQGLSGTVDLRTIRPLEFGHRVISIGGRGEYDDLGKLNPDAHKHGWRANGVYVDQFADGRIGVAVAVSYSHEPYEIKEFNAWGYNTDASGNSYISGSKSYNTSTDLKRLGLTGTLEFKPTPEFTSTFDGFYSNFKDDQTHRGIEAGFTFFGTTFDPSTATASNGLYTSGTFDNVQGVVRNNIFQRHAKLYSFGWNNAYHGEDGWNATADISWNKTKRNERDLESYSGTGYNWSGNDPSNHDATDTWDFKSGSHGTSFTHDLDYSDPDLILLTDSLGWGGATPQTGYNNNRVINDRIWQFRGELEKELQSNVLHSIQAGANYTMHRKSLDPQENFVVLADGSLEQRIPDKYILPSTNLQYLGLGPMLTFNPLDLIKDGIFALAPNASPDIPAKAYSIDEKLVTLYTQANIRADLGDLKLTGNIGVQAIHTDQSSSGNQISGAVLTPYNDGAKYWDILPSLNLSLRFPSDTIVRFAVARQVMRPRMDDMRASLELSTTNDPNNAAAVIPQGSRGDPRLRPYRANSVDLTFEQYFGSKGYLAAQFFYKDLKSYVLENQQVPFDFGGITFTGQTPTTNAGFLTEPLNIKGGNIKGVELAGTLPFNVFTRALDGFGVTGSGSYTKAKSDLVIDGSTLLPGYSKWVASGTAFFEKWGFSARGSVRYRSSFRGEVVGFGDSRVLRFAAPETIVDAQIGYEFPDGALKGLSIYVQGQNLTDERFATHLLNQPLQVIDYQTYGRRYLAGFTYKF